MFFYLCPFEAEYTMQFDSESWEDIWGERKGMSKNVLSDMFA